MTLRNTSQTTKLLNMKKSLLLTLVLKQKSQYFSKKYLDTIVLPPHSQIPIHIL